MAKKKQSSKAKAKKQKKSDYGDDFNFSDFKQKPNTNDNAYKAEPKSVKVSTLILAIALTIAVVLMIVFAVLFFSSQIGSDVFISFETQDLTVAVTVKETEKPTSAPTSPPTEKEEKEPVQTRSFEPYLITVYPPTDIHTGPGTEYRYVMTLNEQGVYTIVDECYNTKTHTTWGKLKSGVGWINIDEAVIDIGSYEPFKSYTINIVNDIQVYEAPSYNSSVTMSYVDHGVYTIVEEYYDEYGNLWGKLKSGIGWINIYDATA